MGNLDSGIGLQREDLFIKIFNFSDIFLNNRILDLILEKSSKKHLTAPVKVKEVYDESSYYKHCQIWRHHNLNQIW